MKRRGFTLLEMLVATAIMGIAVVSLLANLSASLRHTAMLTGYDRAALLAREKMDELLLDPHLPEGVTLQGALDPSLTGGGEAGWSALLTPFEIPPQAGPGAEILDRLELRVWWGPQSHRRTLTLDTYRRGRIPIPEQQP
jgi:general secretion pathway protein I